MGRTDIIIPDDDVLGRMSPQDLLAWGSRRSTRGWR